MEEIKRTVGNRRSADEIERVKEEANKTRFTLMEQPDFKGTKEDLELMQKAERAYREGHPIMTDMEWDNMVKKFNYLESLDEVVSPNGRKWHRMLAPLVSIRKVQSETEVRQYLSEFKGPWMVEPKLDGITFCAIYEKNEDGDLVLSSIGSRGDGRNSLIIEETALWGVEKHGLPEIISKEVANTLPLVNNNGKDTFELRGEVLVSKSDYPDSVQRTISSGICNRKAASTGDGKGVGIAGMNKIDSLEKCLSFEWPRNRTKQLNMKRAYYDKINNEYKQESEIGNENFISVPKENLYFISYSYSDGNFNRDNKDLISSIPGVRYVDSVKGLEGVYKITDDPEEVIDSIRKFYGNEDDEGYIINKDKRQKSKSEFAVDGVVIKQYNDSPELQQLDPHVRGGKLVLPHDPKNVVAVKLKSYPNLTKILKINKKETSLGNVTVTADLEPFVAEDGKVVKTINLHNEEWLALPENEYLKEGAEIIVYQSMDIISVPQPLTSIPKEVLEKLKRN